MINSKFRFFLVGVLNIISFLAFAQSVCQSCEEKKKKLAAAPLTRVLVIFDASNSMRGKWNGHEKIVIAKKLAHQLIDSVSKLPNVQLALRVYGATVKYPPGDCKDSKLTIPFKQKNIQEIKQYIDKLKPTGITPIEYSLLQSVNDFPDKKSLNNIIIITDGIEECNGNPCQARGYLESQGIIFKPFIIGIGLNKNQIQTFNCVGTYIDSEQKDLFNNVIQVLEQQKLNKTTLQVNLLDIAGRPLETDVNTTFYDAKKNQYLYNFIHALNEINNPDTLTLPSHIPYKIVAHTIPSAESEIVHLNEGTHNIIPINAPQGSLSVLREKGVYNFNEKIRVVIRDVKTKQILNVQNLNSTEKYIVGKYEMDILTLPKIHTYIEIIPAKTTTISIPSSGELKIQSLEAGDGSIFLVNENNPLEWICNLSISTEQTYNLLPANYKIVWRPKSMRSSIYTIQKEIEVKPHQSYLLKLY